MEPSDFFVEQLVRDRLASARAEAAMWALASRARAPRRPARVAVGRALVRLGQWLAGRKEPISHPPPSGVL